MKILLLRFLEAFNFFKKPFQFYFDANKALASFEGGIISLMILGILILSFCTSDFVNKTNPIISERLISNTSPSLSLNNMNFAPVIYFYHVTIKDNKIISEILKPDPQYFSINVSVINSKKDEYNLTSYELHDCTKNDFDETLDSSYYSKGMCFLYKNQSSLIDYTDTVWWSEATMLMITVNLCINSTSNEFNCKPRSEIVEFLTQKQIYFYFGYLESLFFLDDYEHPERKNLGSFIQQIINPKLSSKLSLYYMETELILKDQLGLSTSNVNYIQEDSTKRNYQYNIISENEDNALIEIDVYPSYTKRIIKRRYQTVSELISFLGGLASALQFFGMFAANIFIYLKVLKKIINKFYNLDEISKGMSPIEINSQKFIEDLKHKKNNNDNFSNEKQEIPNNIFKNVHDSIHFQNGKYKNLQVGVFEYFKMRIKKLCLADSLNKKEKIIQKCENIMKNDLEIFSLIKTLKQFEILKRVIFTSRQLRMFNSIKLAVVMNKNEENCDENSKLSCKNNEDDEENMKNISEIDKRLLNFIMYDKF